MPLTNLQMRLNQSRKQSHKVAIVGIGSELRGDDAIGVRIVESLSADPRMKSDGKIILINAATAPENFTGELVKFSPQMIVFIDAADFGQSPGTVKLIEKDSIGGLTFSTHSMPLSMVISYLETYVEAEIMVCGIQPQHTDFGADLSQPAKRARKEIVTAVLKSLGA
jgi:hydrogenase 3 maturation protease